jgi:hypothetical protein
VTGDSGEDVPIGLPRKHVPAGSLRDVARALDSYRGRYDALTADPRHAR